MIHVNSPASFFSSILWSDKTKIELFDHMEEERRSLQSKEHHTHSETMFWGSFLASGPGSLVKINGIVKKKQYLEILQKTLDRMQKS